MLNKLNLPREEAREGIRKMLSYVGEDPDREGLQETPDRCVRAWGELYAGYDESPEQILSKRFSETDGYDQLVLLKNIGFFSACEHHVMAFFGVAHVGYLPSDKGVVGISKLPGWWIATPGGFRFRSE